MVKMALGECVQRTPDEYKKGLPLFPGRGFKSGSGDIIAKQIMPSKPIKRSPYSPSVTIYTA
jgi:hypothetical protein